MGLDMFLYRTDRACKGYNKTNEVAYWRKFNALHNYFVQNFQGGLDECQESQFIEKEDLLKLIEVLKRDELEPISGYFFGPTEKDQGYHEQRLGTIEIISELVESTNWENQVLFYQSSW